MPYDPTRHHRRSIRLRGYDYTQAGMYYVTICTQDRNCIFGQVQDGHITLNPYGQIAHACWLDLPSHYAFVALDAFVVMPNHVHGVITLHNGLSVGAGLKPAPTGDQPAPTSPHIHGLPEIVRALKSFSSRRINTLRGTPGTPVWQRNYYEHVVRTEDDLNRIREYIFANPTQWADDVENPERRT
ncbi:MAG: transposase [Dehalococcoidia bacterium]|nr:transposase [Dehalococcoidia bacterium]